MGSLDGALSPNLYLSEEVEIQNKTMLENYFSFLDLMSYFYIVA